MGSWLIRAFHMSGSQYDLPGGAVGQEFVDLLISEVRLLIDNSAVSDCLMTSDIGSVSLHSTACY